jgi:hypothetical protein
MSKSDFSEQEIEVQTVTGSQRIEAQVMGALAYHPSVTCPEVLVITHLPTGCLVATDLRARQARQVVRWLNAQPVDWQFTNSRRVPRDVQQAVADCRRRFGL